MQNIFLETIAAIGNELNISTNFFQIFRFLYFLLPNNKFYTLIIKTINFVKFEILMISS